MSKRTRKPVARFNPSPTKRRKVNSFRTKQITALGEATEKWFELPDAGDEGQFPPIPSWAFHEDDEPQTFEEFRTMERWKVTLYVLPMEGDGFPKIGDSIKEFAEFAGIYFQMPVEILPPLPIVNEGDLCLKSPEYLFPITNRKNEFGHRQLQVMDILNVLTEFLPKKGYSVLGITNYDIFEEIGVEIMGRGTGDRVGVLSLYRYQPCNLTKTRPKKKEAVVSPELFLLRACKTMVHEMMHMFGLDHCAYFLCVMNSNVSPNNDDADPLHICPIDLKKLRHSIGFDVMERYKQLLTFYEEHGWREETKWMKSRIKSLQN